MYHLVVGKTSEKNLFKATTGKQVRGIEPQHSETEEANPAIILQWTCNLFLFRNKIN